MSGFPRRTVAVYAGFQTLLIQNLGEFQILQNFEWFSGNSGQNSQNLGEINGIPVRLTEHLLKDFQCRPWGGGGGGWISSGIAHCIITPA